MSINSERPHLFVLPEDRANEQMANGFYRQHGLDLRAFQVLPIAGGWVKLLKSFEANEISGLLKFPNRYMVLLIDFDDKLTRLIKVTDVIPQNLRDRVFVLGVLSQPEKLKSHVKGGYETIGLNFAKDCMDGTDITWNHALLKHNRSELQKIRTLVRPFLFVA